MCRYKRLRPFPLVPCGYAALIVYYRRPKQDKRKSLVQSEPEKKSLLGLGETQDEPEEKEAESVDTPKLDDWISYWKPNLTISLVDDFTV